MKPSLPSASWSRSLRARDFSDVTTVDAARRLAALGHLAPARLFPPELGGSDAPGNIVYVPTEVADAMGRTTAAVLQHVGPRYATTVDVVPERKGGSVVPSRIRIRAGLVADANAFSWTIEVW
jgi:hypothetical protein